jgi:hypothetical protein
MCTEKSRIIRRSGGIPPGRVFGFFSCRYIPARRRVNILKFLTSVSKFVPFKNGTDDYAV